MSRSGYVKSPNNFFHGTIEDTTTLAFAFIQSFRKCLKSDSDNDHVIEVGRKTLVGGYAVNPRIQINSKNSR